MNDTVVIAEGKTKTAFYFKKKLILTSIEDPSDFTQLIMELGFEYTYNDKYHQDDAFPDNLP